MSEQPTRPPEFEPRADRRRAALALIVLGTTAGITTASLMVWDPLDIIEPVDTSTYDATPERIAVIAFESPGPVEPSEPAAQVGVPASMGGRAGLAKKEEGRVGGAPQRERDGDGRVEAKRLSGLIGTRGEANNGATVQDVFAGDDGAFQRLDLALPGVEGAAVANENVGLGGGGLGGGGLGGGAAAEGLGGLGTKGRGAGGVGTGYGSGGGSFGARGQGGVGIVQGSAAGAAAPQPVDAVTDPGVADRYPVAGPLFGGGRTDDGWSREAYTDYGISEMQDPRHDPWSTFAADVDTASWSISRRKLREGHLPPQAAVRTEEYVNAFTYAYVAPHNGAPFAVNMEAAPDPVTPGHTVFRVGVQGMVPEAHERRPVRLTFLVDVSGSMRGDDRLGLARQSLEWMVDRLGPEDSVSLVTYAGRTEVVLEPTPAHQRQTIKAAIRHLAPGGGTNMDAGVSLAYDMAERAYVEGAENRVVVLSDGDANIGRTSHEALLETIRQHAEGGITLSTVGFGSGNYQDTMMEQLADKGDGNYAYIDGIEEARRHFGEKLGGTLRTIAKDVKLQVTFDADAVVAWRLRGYENRDVADKDFRNDAVDGGEIGQGHQVTAVYDLVLRKDLDPAQDLARVSIRAKKPGPDRPAEEWETRYPAGLVRPSWEAGSVDLRAAWVLAGLAGKLRGEPYAAGVEWSRLSREADALVEGEFARAIEIVTQTARARELATDGLATR